MIIDRRYRSWADQAISASKLAEISLDQLEAGIEAMVPRHSVQGLHGGFFYSLVPKQEDQEEVYCDVCGLHYPLDEPCAFH